MIKGHIMRIKSLQNGPNMLETDENLTLKTGGGEKLLKSPCYLCRCGLSKNKPLCDGSHLPAKFEAPASEIIGVPKV
jgi:CDGSH iron-sulfur domain-containing protein 3